MSEETFNIQIKNGEDQGTLNLRAHWDEAEEDSYFTVYSGSETFGVLHKNGNDMWEWKEGSRSQEEADAIGDRIDAVYE